MKATGLSEGDLERMEEGQIKSEKEVTKNCGKQTGEETREKMIKWWMN